MSELTETNHVEARIEKPGYVVQLPNGVSKKEIFLHIANTTHGPALTNGFGDVNDGTPHEAYFYDEEIKSANVGAGSRVLVYNSSARGKSEPVEQIIIAIRPGRRGRGSVVTVAPEGYSPPAA